MRLSPFLLLLLFCLVDPALAQLRAPPAKFPLARLKYSGGGDWYKGPTEIPNLLAFIRRNTTISTAEEEAQVEVMDENFFAFPMLYLTGHGNIRFSDEEIRRLRLYLEGGDLLFVNDDYGMDRSFSREVARLFADKRLVELPPSFGIYHTPYRFPQGLPKIHEHDGGRPQGFGVFHEDRLVLFYSYESDIGDGWNDPEIHKDPPEKRESAFKLGTNIVYWVLTH